MESLAVYYLAVVVLLAAALAIVARRFGHAVGTVRLIFGLQALGLIAIGYGLLMLRFDGYVEDYGSEPARTLDLAFPLLAIGAVLAAVAWFLALRRPDRS
jgi:hypothetical protein